MPRKHVDPLAAKAAKQKKIAIGGGIVFVLLLVFMVPKTMKLMHPHHDVPTTASSSASSTTTTSTSATSSTAPTATPTTAAAPPASVPISNTPATTTVLTATLAPAAREGQLETLSSTFTAKDPFKQLIDPNAPPPTTTVTSQAADAAKPAAPATPAKPTTTGPELKVVPTVTPPTGGPAPVHVTPKAVLPLLSALIIVNGAPSQVNLRLSFPTAAPLFHLISLTKKTAKVSVVGGSLAGGTPTLTLRRDKPVTLVNTADGTRYKLELMSTSTQAAVTKKPGQPAAATTQRSTTPTTPTTTPSSDTSTTSSGG
jgi:hypothetical protein